MITSHKLSSKDERPAMEQKKYRSMIGGLQYLTHTRLDIENAVGIVAIFQSNPKECHFVVVKRKFRHLKGTSNHGIWYDRSSDFTLCVYIDADWECNMDDRKSTSGGVLFLGGRVVSWLSKKQDYISHNTAEVEYAASTNNSNQVMWMKQMLKDFRNQIEEPIIIYYDNISTVSISKNLVLHYNAKHTSIKYHVLREKATEKLIRLEYVITKDQIVDMFMKPFPKDRFEYLRGMLVAMPLPTSE